MVRAKLRALLEDSSSAEVLAEADGPSVRVALDALFEAQPASIEWLAQFHPEVIGINIELTLESVEARAVRILRGTGLDARLHHTGGGIWVAEVASPKIPGPTVWVTDSEGDDDGEFLVGVYPDTDGQPWFEALSGPCFADDLAAYVRRGLSQRLEADQ
jgi:hypothetical protein